MRISLVVGGAYVLKEGVIVPQTFRVPDVKYAQTTKSVHFASTIDFNVRVKPCLMENSCL